MLSATDNDLAWMKWMVDPFKTEKVKLGMRRNDFVAVSRPWTVVSKGIVWSAAANGSAAVFVRGHAGFPEPPSDVSDYLRPLLSFCSTGRGTSFDRFRDWCGKSWGKRPPCDRCDGQWAECCPSCFGSGTIAHTCGCGDKHDAACGKCQGYGALYCACVGDNMLRPLRGVIHGAVFNRTLISQFLACLDAKTVCISCGGPGAPLYIDEVKGGDWRLVVMPMTAEPDQEMAEWG